MNKYSVQYVIYHIVWRHTTGSVTLTAMLIFKTALFQGNNEREAEGKQDERYIFNNNPAVT